MENESRKTILVVEDEHEVRTFAVLTLEKEGHRVLEAAGAAEAERLWQANPNIDLVIVDIWLPEMRGVELAAQFHARRSTLKAIFVAGFAARISAKDRKLMSGAPVIKKPFPPEELVACVKKILSS